VDRQESEPYGWSARVDLYECDISRLRSRDAIEEFVDSLCSQVLGMKRHGDLLIDWFGSSEDKTGGFSFVQMIETSSVVGHASESQRSLYLDIFSCKDFDAHSAAQHAATHFGAGSEKTAMDVRH
jgi:S-adenosylmethionine decarboxylase